MKAKVDPNVCIACGLCAEMCSEVFEMEDDTAIVISSPVPPEFSDVVHDAAEQCPVDAILLEDE